ncbi:MAG: ABC transporter substrate-binding protein [Mycobacterium sp.]
MSFVRNRRVLSALAAAAMLLAPLAACSSGQQEQESADSGSAPFPTVQTGALTVGVPTFPPFVGLEGGTITGPDGDIVNAIAEHYGLEVVARPYDFAALIPAVQQGRIDVAIGSIFRTHERNKSVDFSHPLYIEPGAFIATEPITSIDSLIGKRVGTVQGYNWNPDLEAIYGDSLALYPSSSELKQDLIAGRLDAAVDSQGTALYLYQDDGFTVTVLPADGRVESTTAPGQTAFVLAKDKPELKDGLNSAIKQLHEDGSIAGFLEEAGLDPAAATTGDPRFA